jgi:hypothetical protein
MPSTNAVVAHDRVSTSLLGTWNSQSADLLFLGQDIQLGAIKSCQA